MEKIDLHFNINKSIEQLENIFWGEGDNGSPLANRCLSLRKKPLKDFETEDLRVMIGQNIALEYLIPIAINELKRNILSEGNCYPGDLLHVVLVSNPEYWRLPKIEWRVVYQEVNSNILLIKENDLDAEFSELLPSLIKSFEEFKTINSI